MAKKELKAEGPKVKLMILKYVGKYQPGEVEVSEEEAEHLLSVGEFVIGGEMVKHVRAMKLEDYKAQIVAAKDASKMTSAEAIEAKVKNVVQTPGLPPQSKKVEASFSETKE